MNKIQEFKIRAFIATLRPDDTPTHRWDLLKDALETITFHKHDDWAKGVVELSHDTLVKFSSQEYHDHALTEIERFHGQLYQDHPGEDVATVEQIKDSYIVDCDGVDVEYGTTRNVYHLFKPWRSFKAGEVIYEAGYYDLQGHFNSNGWKLYEQEDKTDEDQDEKDPEPVETKTTVKEATNDDEEDGYW